MYVCVESNFLADREASMLVVSFRPLTYVISISHDSSSLSVCNAIHIIMKRVFSQHLAINVFLPSPLLHSHSGWEYQRNEFILSLLRISIIRHSKMINVNNS